MSYTQRLSERIAVIGQISAQSSAAGTLSTAAIDTKLFNRVLFIVQVGAMTTNGTLDFSVKGDTASGGSYATTITGKSITQLTEAGTDANKIVLVEVTADEVAAQGLRYLRGDAVTATAACLKSVIVLGANPRYHPASDNDLAAVDEIVN